MIPLLIIIIGVLCGALPTVLWWRERKERQRCYQRLEWYRMERNKDGAEKVAWRTFMKKLAKHCNITTNCQKCGQFIKLSKDNLLDRIIPAKCDKHKPYSYPAKGITAGRGFIAKPESKA